MSERQKWQSHAVSAQRIEALDAPDDFPTPPWATRALIHHVIGGILDLGVSTCLEPACGRGHMSKVLDEYFLEVTSSDAFYYGYASQQEFLTSEHAPGSFDWVITNPPFKHADQFILRSLEIARVGVAILARTVLLEGVGRYNRIFKDTPPSYFAQFVERVPMVRGRIDIEATTATGYAWLVWRKDEDGDPKLVWIPPSRKKYEREGDYSIPAIKDDFGHLI